MEMKYMENQVKVYIDLEDHKRIRTKKKFIGTLLVGGIRNNYL